MILIWIARFILFILGWKPMNDFVLYNFLNKKRQILILSHSTKFDFFILALYQLSQPKLHSGTYSLMKPQVFNTFTSPFLDYLGCIPSSRIEDNNQGRVNALCFMLQNKDKYRFSISPKGTVLNKPWRSGYYHMLQILKCDMGVYGLDYNKHEIKYIGIEDPLKYNKEELETLLKSKLYNIMPLNPENECYETQNLPTSILGF